jgi:hypothetical protein
MSLEKPNLKMEVLSLDKKEKCFSNEGRKGFAFKKQGMFCVISCQKLVF